MPNKLLVIDDSLTVRKMVELSFRDAGWSIDFAATGGEGAHKALAAAPDVVLLDFILPDMKAIDVCERLAADPRGGGLAVILMSAKMEKVRNLFAPYPMVVDFVAKPFSTGEIVERASRARAGRAASRSAQGSTTTATRTTADRVTLVTAPLPVVTPGEPPPAFTFKQKEVAANAMYQRVRRELAAIPGWMAKLGDSPPAMYFARKILTAEVIEGVLESLAPLYREVFAPSAPSAPEPAAGADAGLAGQVGASGLRDLLRLLAQGQRTGELRISHGVQTVVSHWQSGEIVMVSSHDPIDYLRGGPALDAVPVDERERAELTQRATGVPVYVTLHERGLLQIDLAGMLERQGQRLLDEARAASAARFAWNELDTLPAHVAEHGRHIPLEHEANGAGLAQATLERLRRPSSWRELQLHLPGPEAVYIRANGFSSRLTQLSISASEQRVLALVDGRHPLTAIAERSGIAPAEVARILHRLAAIDLLVAPAPQHARRSSGAGARPVMILDPDRDGFQAPLRTLLASRAEPLDLIDLACEADLLGAIQREQPLLVILNGATPDVGDVARAIRATPHLANVSLAAVFESQVKTKMDDLAAAGFDAVLVKPVLYSDLSKLITSSVLAAGSVSRASARENHGEDTRR